MGYHKRLLGDVPYRQYLLQGTEAIRMPPRRPNKKGARLLDNKMLAAGEKDEVNQGSLFNGETQEGREK